MQIANLYFKWLHFDDVVQNGLKVVSDGALHSFFRVLLPGNKIVCGFNLYSIIV